MAIIPEYKIIANPTAGKERALNVIKHVRNILQERKVRFDLTLTKEPGDAAELARTAVKEGWQIIVSLGGDGTASEVISGLVGSNASLGIISCGTGNDFARSLGIPTRIEPAINTLLAGKKRKIDVGWERDQIFANIAGVGFASEVTSQANSMKRLKGSLAFLTATYKALSSLKAQQVRIELDNDIIETKMTSITISNMKYAGGGMVFAPDAIVDDGLFDVCVVNEIGKLSFAMTFPQMYKEKGAKHPALTRYRSSTVNIFTDQSFDKMFDGNIKGKTPLNARILSKAIDMIVPYSD